MSATDFTARLLRIQPRLLNFAMILTSDRDEAYRLLQESTLTALDHSEEYDGSGNFERWAESLMRRIYTDHYRHADKPGARIRVDFGMETADEIPEGSLTVVEISSRIASLNEPDRRIVTMWVVGYTGDEIASELHLDRRAVVRHLKAIIS